MTNEPEERVLPEGYEVGDWDFDPEKDPAWDDPKIPRRRVPLDEYPELADAVVRWASIEYCVIENLHALIEAVQKHPKVLSSKLGEEDGEGFARTIGVFKKTGDRSLDTATRLRLHGCLIKDVNLLCIEIQCSLECSSRFSGDAEFGGTRFAGEVDFQDSRFDGKASFTEVRFGSKAVFDNVHFKDIADFTHSRFGGEANFVHTYFDKELWFSTSRFYSKLLFENANIGDISSFSNCHFKDTTTFRSAYFSEKTDFRTTIFDKLTSFRHARFNSSIDFTDARFYSSTYFDNAFFAGESWLFNTFFNHESSFIDTVFAQQAYFDGARFMGECRTEGIELKKHCSYGTHEGNGSKFFSNNDNRGDFRKADVRCVYLHHFTPPPMNSATLKIFFRHLIDLYTNINWTLIRAIGELSILARVSFVALIFVPMLASAWPAVRVGVTGYNDSVVELSERFEDGAEALRDVSGELEGGAGDSLIDEVDGVEASIQAWSDRFGRMAVDDQNLPSTMAFAFFAAAFVTVGQLVYQSNVPATIRKYDEEAFIEWMHGRYHDDTPDRADGLRRACEYLKVIADAKPERNANFVKHHNEMIWIPPKDKIEWFEDVELADGESYPEGYVPAAERERIALEEGAKAEYWYHAQKSKGYARACFFAYAIGMILLFFILILQGVNVARAAWGF
ncbi:MAG: pentapeptide repeat-containing protein [Phycisphaerales bacterium]